MVIIASTLEKIFNIEMSNGKTSIASQCNYHPCTEGHIVQGLLGILLKNFQLTILDFFGQLYFCILHAYYHPTSD